MNARKHTCPDWRGHAGEALVCLALLAAGGMLPPLQAQPGSVGTLLALTVGLLLLLPPGLPGWRHLVLLPGLALFAICPPPARIGAILLCLASLRLVEPGLRRADILLPTALVAVLYSLALAIPQFNFVFDAMARGYSHLLGLWAGKPLLLGEGALLHVPLFFLLRGMAGSLSGEGWGRLFRAGAGVLLQAILLALAWRSGLATPEILSFYGGLLVFVLLFMIDQSGWPTNGTRVISRSQPGWAILIWPIAPAVLLVLGASGVGSTNLEGLKVGFRQAGGWSPEMPVGMQGAVPQLGGLIGVLRAWGADVRLLDEDELTSPDIRVLYMVQPDSALPPKQRAALQDWMHYGGALVLIGEHTHVNGVGTGINSLLAPGGMRIRDDSAIPLLQGWLWSYNLRFLLSPLTTGLEDSQDLGVSIGASVETRYPAWPLITGSLSFADTGDSTNARGRMGNTRPDPGERLGNVALVSAEPVGRGMRVVLGDKSPFMSLNNPQVWPFYLNLTGRLAQRSPLLESRWLLGLAFLLLAAGVLNILGRTAPRQTTILAGALVLVLLLPNLRRDKPPLPLEGRSELAWLDTSHQPNWLHPPDLDWSGKALLETIFEAKALPLHMRDFCPESLPGSRLVLINGPARAYSRGEARQLREYVEGGGRLVVAGDGRRAAALETQLDEFGLALGDVPLGSAPEARLADGELAGFRFYEAWPVKIGQFPTDTLVSCWGYPIVVRRQLGRGNVIVVGDERLFTRWGLLGEGREGKWRSTGTRFKMTSGPLRARPVISAEKRRHLAEAQRRGVVSGVSLGQAPLPDEVPLRARFISSLLGLPEPSVEPVRPGMPFPGERPARTPPMSPGRRLP